MATENNEFADAIERGDINKLRELLSRTPDLVHGVGWTPPPLHCAVLWNQPAVAKLLLESGADLERRDPDRNTTPLRYAIVYAKPEMVQLLISQGANSGAIVEEGTTAMQLAVSGVNGEFGDYEDLPDRSEYQMITELLQELGVKQ